MGSLDELLVRGWSRPQARWNALVAAAEAHSPNLRMVSYYRWPQIGAL